MLEGSEKWYESRTLKSLMIPILVFILGVFKVVIDPELLAYIEQNLDIAIGAITALISVIGGIVYRIKALKRIE